MISDQWSVISDDDDDDDDDDDGGDDDDDDDGGDDDDGDDGGDDDDDDSDIWLTINGWRLMANDSWPTKATLLYLRLFAWLSPWVLGLFQSFPNHLIQLLKFLPLLPFQEGRLFIVWGVWNTQMWMYDGDGCWHWSVLFHCCIFMEDTWHILPYFGFPHVSRYVNCPPHVHNGPFSVPDSSVTHRLWGNPWRYGWQLFARLPILQIQMLLGRPSLCLTPWHWDGIINHKPPGC